MIALKNVYHKVRESMSKEAIDLAIHGESVDEWQRLSYPVITKQFENLAGKHSKKAWVKRLAYTYSWHPQTPSSVTPTPMKENFSTLEKKFFNASLRKVKLMETEEDEKLIRYKKKLHELSEFIVPIGSLIYGKEEIDYQLSSVSKVLHFMFPNLFPLFDRKACETVFGSNYQSYSRYFRYISAFRTYLQEGENAEYVIKQAEKEGLSPLYVMELALYADRMKS
ncbi:hypothetical protein [Oceanobacillus salinisoli]|uniref:hypothetical protein n=1 Tax=Oceanobacillus salinisoli TaxID=2678611 RepID=UPI0012E2770D|nr:hypothetical protein [Oceanobacillus salinisoli]